MVKKQSYLEEAQTYFNQVMNRAMAAEVRRSVVVRAGTLGALGGLSALQALLAACGAGGEAAQEAQKAVEKVEGKEKLRYPTLNPLVNKYNWRNLPWPTTPYIDGKYQLSGGGITNFALLTNAWTSGGRWWQTLMQQQYGAGVDLDHPPAVPTLADRTSHAPDYSYFDYHVRPNTYFHNFPPVNGRLLTAEDVRYSLELWRTQSVVSASMEAIDRLEVLPDKETVRVHVKKPVLWMDFLLGAPNTHIFAKEHYEGDKDVWKQQPIGSGPLMVTKSIAREGTTHVRHPKYSYRDPRWPDYQLPFLRGLQHTFIGDAATIKSAFRSRQIDLWYLYITLVDFNDMLATNPDATIQSAVSVGYYPPNPVSLNNTDPLLRDVRVRRALNMAIDRKTMLLTLTGNMGTPNHPVTWNQVGRDAPYELEEMGPYLQYNPVKAKELLKEAGYPDGFEIEWLIATVDERPEMTAKYLGNIGVRVKFDRQESSVVSNKMSNRDFKHMGGHWSPSSTFGVKPAREIFIPDSPLNWSRVNDPEMTAIVDKATYSLDAAEMLRLLESVNQRTFDQCYHLLLYTGAPTQFWHPWLQNTAMAVSGHATAYGSWQEAINWVTDKAPGDRAGKLRA